MTTKQEPVGVYVGETWCGSVVRLYEDLPLETPLYTSPQQHIEHCIWSRSGNRPCPHVQPSKPWVGLTDEEIAEIEDGYSVNHRIPAGCAWNFSKDIEAKLRHKNAQPSKPLTDEEIEQCMKQAYATVQGRNLEHAFARAIEAAHGITGESK